MPVERVRRETLAGPGPGEKPLSPRPAASPAARGPAPPAKSDGGGSAEGPASGKRWSSGPAPPSAHQALKPRVFTCRQPRRPGPVRGGGGGWDLVTD